MKIQQYRYINQWQSSLDDSMDSKQTLILVFSSHKPAEIAQPLQDIKQTFPNAIVMGASTSGEVYETELVEEGLVVTVIQFNNTQLAFATEKLESIEDSFNGGQNIAQTLASPELASVFVISDGVLINGSQLTEGMNDVFNPNVVVTGGLAGDGDRFESTWVLVDGKPESGYVSAVGFYGEHIQVAYGSMGGWDRLGIERRVTKSVGNVLYELDGQPALELYKRYLGDQAQYLPASGLLFPLEIRNTKEATEGKVRTTIGVNEADQSIIFAGDIKEGSLATLMKANHDRLIDGALQASEMMEVDEHLEGSLLNIAISCVGRKLVLKQRVEEELEATFETLPKQTVQAGFYSYGEISPLKSGICDLHNQTMTVTSLWETDAPTA